MGMPHNRRRPNLDERFSLYGLDAEDVLRTLLSVEGVPPVEDEDVVEADESVGAEDS